MFTPVTNCRICNSTNLERYIDLGKIPLANNLVPADKEDADPRFDLQVQRCLDCQLSQLTIVVDPAILFSEYTYRTSISTTFQKHFEDMGKAIGEKFSNEQHPIALDIGSNDGCLLEGFQKHGFIPVGIEPATNLADIANKQGITTINAFWDAETAQQVVQQQGTVQVVTATNVFAHVHDVRGFIQNVKTVLADNGMFIIEVPHALNFIQKNEFDTIYHEHLSYFLVKPLITLFDMEGMELFDIQKVPMHGGSIRVFAKKKDSTIPVEHETINTLLKEEADAGLYDSPAYLQFAEKTKEVRTAFVTMITDFLADGKKVAGYAASAKASTLLNYCGMDSTHISFIVDDGLEKQGKAFAGNRIPIVPNSELEKERPDILVIFAWNIAADLIKKTPAHQERKGQYVIPMPFPKVIANENEL